MSDSYRFFDVVVKRCIPLGPSMLRVVFTAATVADMGYPGPDQRIKLFFPSAFGTCESMPRGPDWRQQYRAMDETERPAMRTYTIRALRADRQEVDVDFVLHGDAGPASRWAAQARVGQRMLMYAPDGHAWHDDGGYEWHPPHSAKHVLLVADETALPAVAAILERIVATRTWQPERVDALIEVPGVDDMLPLPHLQGLSVTWLPRDGDDHGARLLRALRGTDLGARRTVPETRVRDVDVDTDILWEQAEGAGNRFYAWVAGEAGVVMQARKHLVNECGIDRRSMNFMGYWRIGRSLD